MFSNLYYISTKSLSVTKPSITYKQKEAISADAVWILLVCFVDSLSANDTLLLKEHAPRTQATVWSIMITVH